jgi:hypothetical protein
MPWLYFTRTLMPTGKLYSIPPTIAKSVLLKTPFAFCFGPLFSLAFAFKRKAI